MPTLSMILIASGLLVLAVPTTAGERPEHRSIHGWVERIEILPEGIPLKAKMDTGATTSSLNALNKETFERDGERWIAFDLIDPENPENKVRLERRITRHVRIIRHDGNHQRRPVVDVELCMGGYSRIEEASLIDRTELNYQALVGRNHMAGIILVDPAETFIQPPRCDTADPDIHAEIEETGGKPAGSELPPGQAE